MMSHRISSSRLVVACVVALHCRVSAAPQSQGLQLGLSNAGMQYALSVAVPILEKDASEIPVPDIHGDAGTPVGHVDYDITGIKATSATIGGSSLVTSPPHGISLGLSSVSVSLNAHWHYRENSWPHISDSGTVDITVSGTSVATAIGCTQNNGNAFLTLTSCTSNIGSVDLHFHGGASWLYNLFKDPIEHAVKNALNGQLCSIIKDELPEANKALAKLPMNYTIDHGVVISYALTDDPNATSTFLLTPHEGILYPPHFSSNMSVPFSAPPLPSPASLPKMLYVWVTTLIPDTAGWAYQLAGVLDIQINASQIPSSVPFQLNTSSFADIIPALQTKYPNQLMNVALVANPNPVSTTVNTTAIDVHLDFNFEFYVVQNASSEIPVFTLKSNTAAAGNTTVSTVGAATTLQFEILFLDMNVSVVETNIGNFDPTEFQTLLNFLITGFVLPKINRAGKQGIYIPTIDGVSLVGPQIVLGDGYVRIDADVHYTPSTQRLSHATRLEHGGASNTTQVYGIRDGRTVLRGTISGLVDSEDANPCENGTQTTCGASTMYCSEACAWNISTKSCEQIFDYPMPDNSSLVNLTAVGSPLIDNLRISFYGDSITWLSVYERVLAAAIAEGPGTSHLNVSLINQGVNGGTVKDLVAGYSPWGRLDSQWPAHNVTFNQSLHGGAVDGVPDIAGIQIGINDVWQATRGSNLTVFLTVLEETVLKPCIAAGIRPYLVSVSTIGEKKDGENPTDQLLDAFAKGQQSLADKYQIPFVDVRSEYLSYDRQYNCLDLKAGILTGDGVHPTDNGGRGGMLLANAHASAIQQTLQRSPPLPNPLPPLTPPHQPPSPPLPAGLRYGGRLFFTENAYPLTNGIKGADAACTQEATAWQTTASTRGVAGVGGTVVAKALLVDEGGCAGQPCRRATVTPNVGDGQIDWPLVANRVYMYIMDDWNTGSPHCYNQASGMGSDWTTRANKTCASWSTHVGPSDAQGVGWTCSTDGGLFDGGSVSCGANHILCVALDAQ